MEPGTNSNIKVVVVVLITQIFLGGNNELSDDIKTMGCVTINSWACLVIGQMCVYWQELSTTAPAHNHNCTDSVSKWRKQHKMAAPGVIHFGAMGGGDVSSIFIFSHWLDIIKALAAEWEKILVTSFHHIQISRPEEWRLLRLQNNHS